MSHWVRHISGQGEKWEVEVSRCPDCWHHYHKSTGKTFSLPKSEYILCDPPEQWVDVTGECNVSRVITGVSTVKIVHGMAELFTDHYRLRKVQVFNGDGATQSMWAFIVEKKVQP